MRGAQLSGRLFGSIEPDRKASQYAMLENIEKDTWNLIATAFQKPVAVDTDGAVAKFATAVAITERLLRNITSLQ